MQDNDMNGNHLLIYEDTENVGIVGVNLAPVELGDASEPSMTQTRMFVEIERLAESFVGRIAQKLETTPTLLQADYCGRLIGHHKHERR